MRVLISISLLFFIFISIYGQNDSTFIYNPNADARKQIRSAIEDAKQQNKNILVQIGGNWCSWCIKLQHFIEDHPQLDSLIKADYIPIKINYSKENRNMEIMADLGYPQRFGFPVLVILDSDGNRIHTQNTVYLEENDTYNEKRIFDFLKDWNYQAIRAESYHK